jgi:uncharacterized protein YecA (UPF0149 family)
MWDFIKKFKKCPPKNDAAQVTAFPAEKTEAAAEPAPTAARRLPEVVEGRAEAASGIMPIKPTKVEKPHAEKTDDELAEELNKISPEILSQAKDPQMRKLVISLYRKMLVDGVDVKNDKEVKKWLKKHPEAAKGGEDHKVETVRRAEPKVGRNDPCSCGSGKKYKKCCGAS